MRQKTIELKMMDGSSFFIDTMDMQTLGIPDNPEAYVNSFLAGSRGPLMQVNLAVDGAGGKTYINPHMIISVKVTYI
ncbi:hypothetical protein CPT_Mater190 [Bacillus phage Mater]|uniref:Uncharacterized protein n=1 Tax=Bacillus phage Mater TaxID=1540090 RepID=A0A0A0RMX7_9CAUD|nr:hypothetical protein CPT_Mater190 [Bacillus phage Mater]AIW03347.1 hypothetical protein CPT_Mater190 [Bacillus phage Mater]